MTSTIPPGADARSDFRHEALFYGGLDDFVSGVTPFLVEAVEAEEPTLVVVSAAKIDALEQVLGADAAGVEFADMAEVGLNPARIIPAWQVFVADHRGAARLRGIGEPIWPERSAAELVECHHHESLLNVAFAGGRPWWLLCPYDTHRAGPRGHRGGAAHPSVRTARRHWAAERRVRRAGTGGGAVRHSPASGATGQPSAGLPGRHDARPAGARTERGSGGRFLRGWR